MILCIGEILADMIGKHEQGTTVYERFAGGAPFNVAVGIANLGAEVGFIGAVGNDLIGKFLADFAAKKGLTYKDITIDPIHNTTLAFVENDSDGERSFCFYRKNTADYHIPLKSLEKIKDSNIIALGSLMLSEKEGIHVADKVLELTKKYNKILSFDVNYRDDIYASKEDAINISLKYVKEAKIVKFSEEEIELLSNESNIDLGVKKITNPNQLVLVTLGKNGSRYYFHNEKVDVPTISIRPIDTTGAGDAFYAGVLAGLDGKDIDSISKEELVNILKRANICGAMACQKKGAMSSLPTKFELEVFTRQINM
jgi:fructokinase